MTAAVTSGGDVGARIGALVRADAVHRSVYTDPALFEVEIERLFGRAWLYVAHESEVARPGDYVARRLARTAVVVVRDRESRVQVLFNRCAHRGAQLVPDGAGHADGFRCAYHGWCYELDGRNAAVTAERGYAGSGIGRRSDLASLQAVPGVASYRGFVFARLVASGPPLERWLGPMTTSIDNLIDRAPTGRISVEGGVLRYLHRCNWKLFAENVCDAYHPMVAHRSAWAPVRRARDASPATPLPLEAQMLLPFASGYDFFDAMGARATAYGHGDLGGRVSIHSAYADVPAYGAAMAAAYGEARAREILALNRNNSVIYPSLMLKAPVQIIRTIHPLAVDRTLVESRTFRLEGAPEEMFERAVLYSRLVNSSAGTVGPDDHELYRRIHVGLQGEGPEWVSLHRYRDPDRHEPDGTRSAPGTSDLIQRNQYAAWAAYLSESLA